MAGKRGVGGGAYRPRLMVLATTPVSLGTFFRGQLRFLARHFDVVVVTSPGPEISAIAEEEGVRVEPVAMTRRISPLDDLKALVRIAALIRREKPDVVHTFTPKAGLLGMMAAASAGVAHRFHTVGGLPVMEARGFRRVVLEITERLTYSCATRVFAVSRSLRQVMPATFPRRTVEIVGNGSANGLDCRYFSPSSAAAADVDSVRSSLGIAPGAVVIAFVGRLVRDKGVCELVDAFERMAGPPRHLLLVGCEEPELDPLPARTRSLIDRDGRIRVTGWVSDVRPYLALADVLALPSYREGFGYALVEAGAMEVPAVASDIVGCNEIVAHEDNGLLVPPKDSAALEAALARLVDDPALRRRLGGRARERVVERYEQGAFHRALLATYRSSLEGLSRGHALDREPCSHIPRHAGGRADRCPVADA